MGGVSVLLLAGCMTVEVPFLWLLRNTVVKAIYGRRVYMGGLSTVSEGESMTSVAGTWQQAGGEGTGAVAERLHTL